MKIVTDSDEIDLGTLETTPTVSMVDYSRRVTDDYGATTVVKRDFARRLSLRVALDTDAVDGVQRTLAGLRATSAQWVADEDYAWLSPTGFFKTLSLDFQTPTLSYCTLTIEGLAESEAGEEDGSEAAPEGSASTMRLLQPVAIDDAALISSNVAEADYPQWDSETGYAAGQRVISTATHRIYESTVNVSIGDDPTATTGLWIDVGPTNRWAMFDQALGTLTSNSGSITVTVNAASINAVALLDVTGESARVQFGAYDRTFAVENGAVSFLDVPLGDGEVTVTVSGTGTLSVGTLLVGRLVSLGLTGEQPSAGINDYSKKETDDFGVVTVVPRSWAKTMTAKALIATDALDKVANRLAAVRATPSLWIADEGTSSLTIYGFFKDWSIEVANGVSTLSLTIEGLSEAAPLTDGLAALAALIRPKTQWSSDGLGGSGASAWHDTYVDGQDFFMRQSSDSGSTWGPAIRAVGTDGKNTAQILLYKRSADVPALPTTTATYTYATGVLSGQDNGWSQVPQASDGNPLYVIAATATGTGATDTIAPTEWADPVVFTEDGATGTDGISTASVFLYQRAASVPALPSVSTTYTFATGVLSGANNGWSQIIPAVNGNPLYITQATALGTGASDSIDASEWATAKIFVQDGSVSGEGPPGQSNAQVLLYKRSATLPAVPSITATYTFSTGVLTNYNNGWSQAVPASDGNPLYVTVAAASGATATDDIGPGEWATPVVMVKDGADGSDGFNAATITLYQRAIAAPAKPSAAITYTFATGAITGLTNGWSANMTSANGYSLWAITAAALGTGATDTIPASEWADPAVIGFDTSDDVLSVAEKRGSLVKFAADLEARYSDLHARAVTLGLSTAALDAARDNWNTLLASYSPAWNDTDHDTVIFTSAWNAAFPSDWSGTAGEAPNGLYTTLTDSDAAAYQSQAKSVTVSSIANKVPSGSGYRFCGAVLVKKDDVAGSTRISALRMNWDEGFTEVWINTSTGEIGTTNTPLSFGVLDLGGDWLIWNSVETVSTSTTIGMEILPAFGVVPGGRDVTITGSVDVRAPLFVNGGDEQLGHFYLTGRLNAFSGALAALANAIGQRDGATSVIIDPPADVIVYAKSDGTVKDGELPRQIPMTASVGTADVTGEGAWTMTATPGVTATQDGATGIITMTALAVVEALVPVQFVFNGVTRTANVHIVRKDDQVTLPSGGGTGGGSTAGTSASTTTLGQASSTTYDSTAVSSILSCTAGSAGQVALTAPINFKRSQTLTDGSTGAFGKWQWRPVGGTFADVAAEVGPGTPSTTQDLSGGEPGVPPRWKTSVGSLTVNMTLTGRDPGTTYEFRFQWREDATDGGASSIYATSGTMTATGS